MKNTEFSFLNNKQTNKQIDRETNYRDPSNYHTDSTLGGAGQQIVSLSNLFLKFTLLIKSLCVLQFSV